jgi:hypothetical protein
LATPFDFINTNDILNLTSTFGIKVVVIIYDQAIDGAGIYDEPVTCLFIIL